MEELKYKNLYREVDSIISSYKYKLVESFVYIHDYDRYLLSLSVRIAAKYGAENVWE